MFYESPFCLSFVVWLTCSRICFSTSAFKSGEERLSWGIIVKIWAGTLIIYPFFCRTQIKVVGRCSGIVRVIIAIIRRLSTTRNVIRSRIVRLCLHPTHSYNQQQEQYCGKTEEV